MLIWAHPNNCIDEEEKGRSEGELKHYKEGFIYGWQQSCHIQNEIGMITGNRYDFYFTFYLLSYTSFH